MILQEYIRGEDWIYHGYCDAKTNLYVSFTGKKVLDYPPGAGATAMGVSCHNEALSSQVEGFLRGISYSGIVDIDFRQDARDGQYKIMDCNPRVGMNFRMFENAAGIDVVRAQHLNLTGRNITCAKMIEGRLFIVESYYLLSLIRGGRNALKTGASRQTSRGNLELAWWSGDDIVPFIVMSARLLFQTVVNALRRMWN
jgi:predicted ATP-grasp superfamily ATP-dependent carboligase